MKSFTCIYLIFIIGGIALATAQVGQPGPKPTGQPGCQTPEELATVNYAHYYLKSSYWVCSVQGVPATLAQCPVAQAWLDIAKACVPWSQWYWSPTVAPPSVPEVATAAAEV